MKTAPHTPGPWKVTDCGIYSAHLNGHGNFYVAALPFPGEEPTAQEKANLALIAAAPDLFAALSALVSEAGPLDFGLEELAMEPEHRALIEQARAALAKANGEAV